MTHPHLIELTKYNLWANQLIGEWCHQITEEQWDTTINSSFSSIKATLLHNIGAESIWTDRLEGIKDCKWIPNAFKGNKVDALRLLIDTSTRLESCSFDWANKDLSTIITFGRIDSNKQETMQASYIFNHVLNHSTYHRGQIVTMLRQVGFNEVGSTDLLTFYKQNIY